MRGRPRGVLASGRRSVGSRMLPLPTPKKVQCLLLQLRAPSGEAEQRNVIKAALPKTPPSTPPIWGMGGFFLGGEEMLHSMVVTVHKGGVEVYDVAGNNVSKSTCERLRKVGVQSACTPAPHTGINKIVYILQCRCCSGTCNTPRGSGLSYTP